MTNIIEKLRTDHRNLKAVMDKLERIIEAGQMKKEDVDPLFQEFKERFDIHDKIEDKIVYPTLQEHSETTFVANKGSQAHHVVELSIMELRAFPYTSEAWGAKFAVVRDSILTHMAEEEEKLFPLMERSLDREKLESLGNQAVEYEEKRKSSFF